MFFVAKITKKRCSRLCRLFSLDEFFSIPSRSVDYDNCLRMLTKDHFIVKLDDGGFIPIEIKRLKPNDFKTILKDYVAHPFFIEMSRMHNPAGYSYDYFSNKLTGEYLRKLNQKMEI